MTRCSLVYECQHYRGIYIYIFAFSFMAQNCSALKVEAGSMFRNFATHTVSYIGGQQYESNENFRAFV